MALQWSCNAVDTWVNGGAVSRHDAYRLSRFLASLCYTTLLAHLQAEPLLVRHVLLPLTSDVVSAVATVSTAYRTASSLEVLAYVPFIWLAMVARRWMSAGAAANGPPPRRDGSKG